MGSKLNIEMLRVIYELFVLAFMNELYFVVFEDEEKYYFLSIIHFIKDYLSNLKTIKKFI